LVNELPKKEGDSKLIAFLSVLEHQPARNGISTPFYQSSVIIASIPSSTKAKDLQHMVQTRKLNLGTVSKII